ncbi:MAG: hypothetical protein ACJ8FY_04195 [Gemmataceae bacterium]
MKTFETTTTVEPTGQVRVASVPFQPGTQVRGIVAPERASAEEFARAWAAWCSEIRNRPNAREITHEEIQKEIDDYRAGR